MVSADMLAAMGSTLLQEKIALPRYEQALQEGLISRSDLIGADVPPYPAPKGVMDAAAKEKWKARELASAKRYTRLALFEAPYTDPDRLERTRQLKDKLYKQQARSTEMLTGGNIRVHTTPHPLGIAATSPLKLPDGRTVAQVWAPEVSGGFVRAVSENPQQVMRARLAAALKPDLLPEMLGSHPTDRSMNLAALQHEIGEANEFLRGVARPAASHLGPEPILREQLALQGDAPAFNRMLHLRTLDPDDQLIQKYIRQAGGTPNSPLPLDGRQHRAVERMMDRKPERLSQVARAKALVSRHMYNHQTPYVPSDVQPIPAAMRAALSDAGEAIQVPGLRNKLTALKQVKDKALSPFLKFLKR